MAKENGFLETRTPPATSPHPCFIPTSPLLLPSLLRPHRASPKRKKGDDTSGVLPTQKKVAISINNTRRHSLDHHVLDKVFPEKPEGGNHLHNVGEDQADVRP